MKEDIIEELKGTILEDVNKKTLNYEVPVRYFENLTEKVMTKINSETAQNHVFTMPRYAWIGMAASIALVLGFLVCLKDAPHNMDHLFENTDSEMLIEYASIDMDLSDVTFDEFAHTDEFASFNHLDDDQLDAYLEDNVDLTDLEEILDFL